MNVAVVQRIPSPGQALHELGLPPDADGNGNYAFFDATNYAAILGRNYAELCSKCGIMLNALATKLPNAENSESQNGRYSGGNPLNRALNS